MRIHCFISTPFLLFCVQAIVIAQKHDYIWPFGYDNNGSTASEFGGAVIDFNHIPTKSVKDNRVLNFSTCCGAFSDSSGALLFYTNGIAVHNFLHQLIENGDTINPGDIWEGNIESGYPSSLGAFALPYPGHPDQYFLFHTAWVYEVDSSYVRRTPFYYTLIDMSANDGKGKVLLKNQILLEGDLGWPAACKHGNGRDWWITNYTVSEAGQKTFLLSPEGIIGPFEQAIGPPFSPLKEVDGKCLFSPDGRTYVRHDGENGLRLMDFDRCTGQFSNLRLLPYPPEIFSWSAAFSPDSRFLYISKPTVIWYLDMQAANLSASFDTLARYNGGYCPNPPWSTKISDLQEGPDGKIYAVCYTGSSTCMSRIEQPLLPGLAADAAFGSFSLARWNNLTICHFPHYRLGEHEGSPCDTLDARISPDDGFYKTTCLPASRSEKNGTPADYVVLPALHAEYNEEARLEKAEFGDMHRALFDSRRNRREPAPLKKQEKDTTANRKSKVKHE